MHFQIKIIKKHQVKDDLIQVSIDHVDFSFRIPVKKIGNTTSWFIGANKTDGIVIQNVSVWTLQLFTEKITDEKYVKQFKAIVQECDSNTQLNGTQLRWR